MKALKALVIGMGVLIVLGIGLLGYGLSVKGFSLQKAAVPASHSVALPGDPAPGDTGYFAVDLPIPSGSRLEQMAVAGNRVLLRLSGTDGDRILVLDPATGHLAGTVTLVGQKP